MFSQLGIYLFLLNLILVLCQEIDENRVKEVREIGEVPINNKLVGVDTVHGVKIDKDTVINLQMNLEQKPKRKNNINLEPDDILLDDDSHGDRVYESIPPEVSIYVADFKRNMSECLKEVQRNDKRTVKRLSPKQESPVHGECLIACVLKRNGVIENGKIKKDNLISLVSKFYAKDVKMMKKLEKNLDRCVELALHNRDECNLAAKLNECTNGLMANNKHKVIVNY